MEIRLFKEEDIKTMCYYENLIFGETLGEDFLLSELNTNEFARYFVMLDEGKIIGQLGLWISSPLAQVINFYIIEEYRRQGLGEKLMNFGIDYMKLNQVSTITLEVRPSNKKAQELYRKLGFNKVAIRRNYYKT